MMSEKVFQIAMAIVGILLMLQGIAMSEPQRLTTEEQRQIVVDKRKAKENLKGIKDADIDACKNFEDCKPLIKTLIKAVKSAQ
ncbi:hypothetical protein [Candidatus Magnetominusculus xianensis]|uniref:Secreted protein n=1 Tax=Candidatus Magnetominusculus xianensis TaxID=1748249 RepID=A0ABR5SBN0_9BACT|nr:hypothetical protein [Candidatus Magnetominusculus xianensis]KWT77353.1 hypothetical protein ASN18_3048 [Candidatus Magnetominusculus xianensis]MBF0404964.1 hypothetical protein [Nitrospirota bacterium]